MIVERLTPSFADWDLSCSLQMHTLRLLERLLAVDYTALGLLRDLGLWDVVYSAAFFGFAENQVSGSLHFYPHLERLVRRSPCLVAEATCFINHCSIPVWGSHIVTKRC